MVCVKVSTAVLLLCVVAVIASVSAAEEPEAKVTHKVFFDVAVRKLKFLLLDVIAILIGLALRLMGLQLEGS